jgi:hypothetical protein
MHLNLDYKNKVKLIQASLAASALLYQLDVSQRVNNAGKLKYKYEKIEDKNLR